MLRHYVNVLRRRWRWVALGVAMGLLGGYVSTLFIEEAREPTPYYKATNTLIVTGGTPEGTTANLTQAAFLLRSSDVLDAIAAASGLTPTEVNDRVSAVARSDVLAVDVTAIGLDPAETTRLADTSAAQLAQFVSQDQQRQYEQARDAVLLKLEELKQQRARLEAEIALDPARADFARAELDSVVNQYRLTYEQLQTIANQGGPAGGLSTLQAATPIQINEKAYSIRLNENRNSRGQLGPSTGAPLQTIVETDLGVDAPPVSRSMRLAIGGAAGLVMGVALAFLVEAWDDRLRRREKVEQVTGLPVIAEVPKLPKDQSRTTDVPAVDAPRSRAAERYRAVRTSLLFALHEHLGAEAAGLTDRGRAPVVLISSPNPAEGKTTTCANLAAVLGDSGTRTLVIDCDYRKPSIAKYLAPVPDLDHPARPAQTRLDGVWFIPAPRGSGSSPLEVVHRLQDTIREWRDAFDMILLDTPPMLTTNDAADLLAVADTVLVVLRAGQTRTGAAERVVNLLARYRSDVLGIVLNSLDDADMEAYYGYYYAYYGDESERGRRREDSGSATGPAEPGRGPGLFSRP
jgi:Mrp family chromosome partitioning ATPase